MRFVLPARSFPVHALFLLPLLVLGAGCGDDDEATTGAGTTGAGASGGAGGAGGAGGSGGGAFEMQAHPPFPEIAGTMSAVIAHPKLVTVTFQGYQFSSMLQAAGDAMVASSWALAVGADYGVADGTHLGHVDLPEAAPAQLSEPQLLSLLDQHITDGLVPAPAADVIYIIFIAPETTFDDGTGYVMCADYLGYHWQETVSNGTLTYGIVGDCGAGFDELTATLAHEYIEAASDPGLVGGYYMQLSATDPWYSIDGYENADLCDYADYVVEGGFTYQRVWSNSAAAEAVTSPCAPIDPAEIFYNVFSDATSIPAVAAGESASFTLTGWSTAPVPDWTLDYDNSYYSDFVPGVELSSPTINNGKQVLLTLTVPPGTPPGRLGTAMMYSGAGYGRFWPVSVRSK